MVGVYNHWFLLFSPLHVRTDLAHFLRRFTLPYRAFRIILIGLDLLERQKRYEDAVNLIRQVLFTKIGCLLRDANGLCPLDSLGPCRVGRLLVRLLVDEGSHLKQPESALNAVNEFLGIDENNRNGVSACPCIRAGLRLELQEQLSKTADVLRGSKQLPNNLQDVGLRPSKRRCLTVSSNEKKNNGRDFSVFQIPDLIPELLPAPKVGSPTIFLLLLMYLPNGHKIFYR